jgi:hypothetical protein
MPNDVKDLQSLPPEVSALVARMSTAGGCISLISITKIAEASAEKTIDGARIASQDAFGICFSLASYAG